MVMREARTLSRDVEVAAIPYGDRLTLTMGTTVFITQALGGSFTAMTDHGYLVRIEGTSTVHDWQVEGHLIGGSAESP